jgi:hypothetical protein
VPTARRGLTRVAVEIDPDVWRDEVERFDARSSARLTAQRERRQLEAEGVLLRQLQRCEDLGDDQTRLAGLAKVYLRDLARGHGVSVRTLDKALWQHSRERSGTARRRRLRHP